MFSGHGNAEEYRPWRPVLATPDGEPSCPAASPDYTPPCWRAGEIIRERCLSRGGAGNECATRAVQARRHFVAAPERVNELTVLDIAEHEWLDAGQCRDCFLPAWQHLPLGSVQHLLARGLRFGFVGSSDVAHRAARHGLQGVRAPADGRLPARRRPAPRRRRSPTILPSGALDGARGDRRRARRATTSAALRRTSAPGGLVAVHAAARSRAAIWEALERREVYATSGPRILLWFELLNGPAGPAADGLGARARRGAALPRARGRLGRRAAGLPGAGPRAGSTRRGSPPCAAASATTRARSAARITRIEVVRIRPQRTPSEPVDDAIEDPWHTFGCRGAPRAAASSSTTRSSSSAARDSGLLRARDRGAEPGGEREAARLHADETGACSQVDTRPTSADDDRLARDRGARLVLAHLRGLRPGTRRTTRSTPKAATPSNPASPTSPEKRRRRRGTEKRGRSVNLSTCRRNKLTSRRTSPFEPVCCGAMDAAPRPSRARHVVLGFALAAMGVAYLDRVAISTAAPAVKADLGLSDTEMGLVFSAFTLRVRAVRGAERLARRPLRRALHADAHRAVVVGDDGGDRRGHGLRVAGLDPLAVRHGRGGRAAEPRARLLALAAPARARPRLRPDADGGGARRRRHAADRRGAARAHLVAARLPDLRERRAGVGGRLVLVVPRRPAPAPRRERRRARPDRLRARDCPIRRCRGASSLRTAG